MIRGMPLLTQVMWVSVPWPPAAWSARLRLEDRLIFRGQRRLLRRGPAAWSGSHWVASPRGRVHWPDQSGYFESSNAAAPAMVQRQRRRERGRGDRASMRRCRISLCELVRRVRNALITSGLLEIAQVRRRLVLLGRHQKAVGAEEVVLLADHHVIVVLAAIVLVPERRCGRGDRSSSPSTAASARGRSW